MNKRKIKQLLQDLNLDVTDTSLNLISSLCASPSVVRKVVDINDPLGFLELSVVVKDAKPQQVKVYVPVFRAKLDGLYSPLDTFPQGLVDILTGDPEFAATIDVPSKTSQFVDTVIAATTDERGELTFNVPSLMGLVMAGGYQLTVDITVDDYHALSDFFAADAVLDFHLSRYTTNLSLVNSDIVKHPKVSGLVERLMSRTGTKQSPSLFPFNH